MENKKNILIVAGGGGTEHEISLRSLAHLEEQLKLVKELEVFTVVIDKDKSWHLGTRPCSLNTNKELVVSGENGQGKEKEKEREKEGQTVFQIDFAIPCLHGHPGEDGCIQGLFECIGLPYLGCSQQTSVLCFDKDITKTVLAAHDVAVSPWISFYSKQQLEENLQTTEDFFSENQQDVYIKATTQGSSVGCYHVTKRDELIPSLTKAFQYAETVLLEKTITGRELEMAVFQVGGEWKFSKPGEIKCPSGFYSYSEKYDSNSKTKVLTEASQVDHLLEEMQTIAKKVVQVLNLRHLARIDFLIGPKNQIYINEVNTFPGMTSISLFPKMANGLGYEIKEILLDAIFEK